MTLVDTITELSESMQKILDLMAIDDELGKDFERFLSEYEIEIVNQNQLTKVMMYYLFDSYTENMTPVLDIVKKRHIVSDNMLESFKNSYLSIFQVKKISINSILVNSIVNEKEYELLTLSKTNSLKSIGVKDYIDARIIKINDLYFLIDIIDVISSNSYLKALSEGINCIVKNPKNIYWDCDEKYKEFEEIVDIMTKSFIKCTGSKCVITTNKLADGLLEYFNLYHHNLLENGEKLENYLSSDYPMEYIDINSVKNNETINDVAFDNLAGGFSGHNALYSVGFWVDIELGIFILPNLGVFFEIFKAKTKDERNKIIGWKDCILEYLNLDKVPVSVFSYANELSSDFLNIIFEVTNIKFSNFNEFINFYKPQYGGKKRFSPTIVLYNSQLFMDILDEFNKLDKAESQPKNIGRNDPCPCGSGKKYKNCCLNK